MSFPGVLPTRFAQCPRPLAWLTVVGAIALLGWGLSVSFKPKPASTPDPAEPATGGTDLDLYEKIINRVHQGESYYAAAALELPKNGYPTSSVFNWRLPTYAWFFGLLPTIRIGQALLIALSVWCLYLSVRVCAAETGRLPAIAAFVWLIGPLVWCVDGLSFLNQEVWAQVLVQLSIVFLAQGRRLGGVVWGVSALLVRELALPYVLLCLAMSLWRRRWLEALGWVFGLGLYAAFTAYHVAQVRAHMPAEEIIEPSSWLCWGGIAFVLDTVRMNQILMLTHTAVRAVYFPLALLGLIAWRGETGLRILFMCVGYNAAFLVVGQPFNNYWGIIDDAPLAMGAALAPWAVRDLYRRCRGAKQLEPASLAPVEAVQMDRPEAQSY